MKAADQGTTIMGKTRRQAIYLWTGLLLAMTLFYVQSQIVFVKGQPLSASGFEWPLIILGALTFLIGLYFFKNYTGVRKKALSKATYGDRKQILLVAFVYQFILFETLGLYGVVLSVLTQNSLKAIPFIGAAYLGFLISFPKKALVQSFFQTESPE